MSDHETIAAYEADFERQASHEYAVTTYCHCGRPAVHTEPDLCRECWLFSLPTCQFCQDAPATEDLGGGLHLCRPCEDHYSSVEWSPEEEPVAAGAYYTPKAIIDPACGTGAFLASLPEPNEEEPEPDDRELGAPVGCWT